MTSRRLLNPEAKILLDAADYMEKHGHCKNVLEDKDGRVCLWGAINRVTCGTNDDLSRVDNLDRLKPVSEYLGIPYDLGVAIINWNNAKERTQEEVVAALRATALSLVSS